MSVNELKSLTLKCSKCGRRYHKFYTVWATIIEVHCPRCKHGARINVARLIETPADLQAAVAQAGTANGIIQHKEAAC